MTAWAQQTHRIDIGAAARGPRHDVVGMTAADLAHESMASRSRGDIEDESRLLERLGTLANSAEVERVLAARESLARLPSVRRAPLPTSPDVTVVIPVHNGIELTRNCLDSLFSTPSRHTARIVVVDDASQDDTGDRATIETTGGTRYAFRRRENGMWGLSMFTAELVAEAERAARDNDVVDKAASDYERAR